ncbi:MAG: hypothetical protein JO290_09270 [Sphingomonadaceae bacterium]|nr:hypothetical protein [Sphingomonadaceae bacterium]
MNLVICVDNRGLEASLEARKIYQRLDDPRAEKVGMVRVVDESGEDYLHPASRFQPIRVEAQLEQRLFADAA